MKHTDIKTFTQDVSNYIFMEYINNDKIYDLLSQEKLSVQTLVDAHFSKKDSINNTAGDIVSYLRAYKEWKNSHI